MIAIAVGAGALSAVSLGSDRSRVPADRRSSAAVRLPAPITIAAGRVLGRISYRIARDGRVSRFPGIRSPFPHDSAWFPDTGVWFSVRRGRLVVGRFQKQLWRSHRDFPQSKRNARQQVGVIAVGSHALAFSYDGKLLLAPLGGVERVVARGEFPVAWTAGELLTYRFGGHELILRRADGALVKTIWQAPRDYAYGYDSTTGTVYWLAHGAVMAARGRRARRLASLRSLGLSADRASVSLQPLGRLLELRDNARMVFVRADGRVFASTPVPRNGGAVETISGGPTVGPRTSGVAFAAAPDRGPGGFGVEQVFVLRAGAHHAVPIHGANINLGTCARGANLEWHGGWLLYTNSEHDIAAIDSTGAHHAIEMTHVVRKLPGTHGGFSAYWSAQPNMW